MSLLIILVILKKYSISCLCALLIKNSVLTGLLSKEPIAFDIVLLIFSTLKVSAGIMSIRWIDSLACNILSFISIDVFRMIHVMIALGISLSMHMLMNFVFYMLILDSFEHGLINYYHQFFLTSLLQYFLRRLIIKLYKLLE